MQSLDMYHNMLKPLKKFYMVLKMNSSLPQPMLILNKRKNFMWTTEPDFYEQFL